MVAAPMNGHTPDESSASEPFDIPASVGAFKRTLDGVDVSAAYGLAPGSMRLARWQSESTGLRVTWFDVEGPLCNLYSTVATCVGSRCARLD